MHLSTRMRAAFALILIGSFAGLAPIFSKIALKEFSSYQVLFIRFGIATLLITPLFIKYLKTITFKKLTYTLPAGLLFSGNVFFFIVGLEYTTSIVSQLFYLLTPVVVAFLSYFLIKVKISLRHVISMIICLSGSSLLILKSIQGGDLVHSIGTLKGNIIILCGVASWGLYLVYTKKISNQFEPSFFLVVNFAATLFVSCLSLFITKTSFSSTFIQFFRSSPLVIFSLLALAVVNSVIFFLLYQWSLKKVSAFIASSSTYISPLVTALFAIPFFGERLSTTLFVSAASIFIGSYFILFEKK